ncbi:MAG: chaplin [Streptosporangiaceae bacterium]
MIMKFTATAVVALGLLASAAPAMADTHTSGNSSVLGGNQVFAPISIPINVCGNAIAVLGIAGAGCEGGAVVTR